MKNLILSLTVILSITLSFQSCSDNGVDNTGSFFTAEVDGAQYNVNGDFQAYATDFSSSTNIYGVTDFDAATNESMYIQLPLGFSEGTHTFSDDVFAYYILGEKAWSSKVGNGSGTITIEKNDGVNIVGTFSYEAFDFDNPLQGMTVAEGRFNVLKR